MLSSSTLAVGSHIITAQYSGSTNFASSSGSIPQSVRRADNDNEDGQHDQAVGTDDRGGPKVEDTDGRKRGQRLDNGMIDHAALLARFFASNPRLINGIYVGAGDGKSDQ